MVNVNVEKVKHDNPKINRKRVTVERENNTVERLFSFTNSQIESGRWKKHIKQQLELEDENFEL